MIRKIQFFCFFFIILAACRDNTSSMENELVGEWTVVEATRNNRPTQTLKDAFFMFTESGSMITNIFGDTSTFEYTLKNQEITQHANDEIIYTIEMLESDSLFLKSKIRNYNFEFLAIRAVK